MVATLRLSLVVAHLPVNTVEAMVAEEISIAKIGGTTVIRMLDKVATLINLWAIRVLFSPEEKITCKKVLFEYLIDH